MDIDELRRVITGHETVDPHILLSYVLNIVEQQAKVSEDLRRMFLSSEERHERRLATLQAQINKLNKVHGA